MDHRSQVQRTDRRALRARDPADWARTIEVWVTHRRLAWAAKPGMHLASDAAHLMPECLDRPRAIFEGIRRYPGLDIEVEGGRVRLSHFFRATAWSEGDPIKKQRYRAVIAKLEQHDITAALEESAC